jgi:hypothetical protein
VGTALGQHASNLFETWLRTHQMQHAAMYASSGRTTTAACKLLSRHTARTALVICSMQLTFMFLEPRKFAMHEDVGQLPALVSAQQLP